MSEHVPAAERHAEDLAARAPALVIVAERWISIVISAFLVLAALLALGVAAVRLAEGLVHQGLDARLIVMVNEGDALLTSPGAKGCRFIEVRVEALKLFCSVNA